MVEVNGQQYQHGTSTFTILTTGGAIPARTVKKVNAKISAKKSATNDSQGNVDGFVIGKKEPSGSLSMKFSEWINVVRPALLAADPAIGELQAQFRLVVTYGNRVNAMHELVIPICMIDELSYDTEDSQEADAIELPLFFMTFLVDGKEPIQYL